MIKSSTLRPLPSYKLRSITILLLPLFRGEEFKKSANQKQESPVAAMFVNGSEQNEQSLQRTFHRCFLPSFGSFGQAVSEEKIFKNLPIRNMYQLTFYSQSELRKLE